MHLDPTGVDLHTPRGASSREFWIAQPALNYFVTEELGNPGVIAPDLAESWDVTLNDDGTADWTFTLDGDAKWHNGEAVTAEDIKFNFDRVKNPPEGLTIGRRGRSGPITKMLTTFRLPATRLRCTPARSPRDFWPRWR